MRFLALRAALKSKFQLGILIAISDAEVSRPRGGVSVMLMWKQMKSAVVLALALAFSIGATTAVRAQDAGAGDSATAKRKVKTRTVPDYPVIAKQLHITGKVKIEATIAADGHVVSTHVVGGSPVLVAAASDALKKWKYEPGPKETTEIVEFDFDGN